MSTKHTSFFRDHLLAIFLVPLITLALVVSFNRFFIKHDYLVSYEGSCDPVTQNCFIGCEDDGCDEEYFYKKMQKYGSDLYLECGNNVSGCESANSCFPENKECLISYCDAGLDGDICETITDTDQSYTDLYNKDNYDGQDVLQNDVINNTNL
jgi:hypothetical protein